MAEGYVCLWRSSIESEFFHDEWLCKLWMWCLCRANYRQTQWRGEVIPPGSFITGRIQGATQLHVSESKFYRGLKRLEKLRMVSTKSNNKFTIVTLCNWGLYQQPESAKRTTDERQSEQPANNQRTTSEQPANTGEEGNKEIKKEGKKNTTASRLTADVVGVPSSLQTERFTATWNLFEQHRREIKKPLTPTAAKMAIKQLAELGHDRAIAAIEHTVAKGWQGIQEAPAAATANTGLRSIPKLARGDDDEA